MDQGPIGRRLGVAVVVAHRVLSACMRRPFTCAATCLALLLLLPVVGLVHHIYLVVIVLAVTGRI
jgi:hypothetical protein